MFFDTRHQCILITDQDQGLLLLTRYPFPAAATGGPLRYPLYAEPGRTKHRAARGLGAGRPGSGPGLAP